MANSAWIMGQSVDDEWSLSGQGHVEELFHACARRGLWSNVTACTPLRALRAALALWRAGWAAANKWLYAANGILVVDCSLQGWPA